jgi:uncharacterized lipoprotein YddW (UPF0748 family)
MGRYFACALLLVFSGCVHHAGSGAQLPPPIQREFRAAWVATVENIDWPSKPGLSSEAQQREIIAILDTAQALHLNAIILQVRTSCDAMYPSPEEPWSYYLTGKQAAPPSPFYDPLKMWVEEAHRRGIELHAWFNPFRAKPPHAKYALASGHIANTRPDLVKTYGSVLWLDPGEPAARDLSLRVMLDVVRRYDIDGIHIDDYFYPYPEKSASGGPLSFPDDGSFARYQRSGGTLSREDWRRDNINQMVHRMYREVKRAKPWVKVGISPFGIWKPGFPPIVKGFNQYESIYADAKLWLNEGWCDYFTPQLYWKTTSPNQPFEALLQWWISQSTHNRHIWPGLFTSRIEKGQVSMSAPPTSNPTVASTARTSWVPRDIVDQIEVTRRLGSSAGQVHFSMITLMQDRQQIDRSLQMVYAEPAIVPPCPWLGKPSLSAPIVDLQEASGTLSVEWGKGDWFEHAPWLWVVQVHYASGWRTMIYPQPIRQTRFPADSTLGMALGVSVTGVDRLGILSEPRVLSIPQPRQFDR